MIDDVYKVVQVILNKNGYGVLTPGEFNSISEVVQARIYADLPNELRMLENRKNQGYSGIPGNVMEQALNKLVVTEDLKRGDEGSPFVFPGDTSALESVYVNGREAYRLDPSRLRFVAQGKYTRPSKAFPCYSVREDGIMVFPEPGEDDVVEANYRKNPAKPNWTYVMIEGKPVFNPSDKAYQDFELTYHFMDKIVVGVALYLGIHLREEEVSRFMNAEENSNFQKENSL